MSVNERRDNWRADFFIQFHKAAIEAESIKEAVLLLNQKVFQDLNVSYHATKRPKPDQSPYETIEAGYASCTGLSILLVSALRSVGIPSRLTGIPLWTNKSGNHTWVEIWSNGQWHHIGAAEPTDLNKTWFNQIASQADGSKREHSIYAVSFKKTDISFPMAWDYSIDYVSAENVTKRYNELSPELMLDPKKSKNPSGPFKESLIDIYFF